MSKVTTSPKRKREKITKRREGKWRKECERERWDEMRYIKKIREKEEERSDEKI